MDAGANGDEHTSFAAKRLIESIRGALHEQRPVLERFGKNGRIYIDRPLPFLCLYRRPHHDDHGAELLVTGEPAYFLFQEEDLRQEAGHILRAVLDELVATHGGFLLLELQSRASSENDPRHDVAADPRIRVATVDGRGIERTLDVLASELENMRLDERHPSVSVEYTDEAADPVAEIAHLSGAHYIRVVFDPVHYDSRTNQPFPLLLRMIRNEIATVLRAALYMFCRERTTLRIRDPVDLGRRELLESDIAVDRTLADISDAVDLVLNATPVNTAAAHRAFMQRPDREPEFHYRHITIDPDVLTRRLYEIPLDEVEDPTLIQLFREQRAALTVALRMLAERNTPKFLYGSLQLFGGVSEYLMRLADGLTAAIPPRERGEAGEGAWVDAGVLVHRAEQEIERYRRARPDFAGSVVVRPDIAGVLVNRDCMMIEDGGRFPKHRVDAIVHHEVGTHLVTWVNGSSQPLLQLRTGLAGYDELQEGLAVLAEYLVGALTPARLRIVAGRVVAVRMLIDGGSFVDIYRMLTRRYGFAARTAFSMTMRVCRSGGLTKDVVYLTGLVWLLHHLETGGALAPLYVGKLGIRHLGWTTELVQRRVLRPPAVMPLFLEHAEAQRRLSLLRRGLSVLELLERGTA